MSAKTTNYGLSKPTDNETADIEVINGNMDILDAKIKEVDDKALNFTVPVTKVNGKTGDINLSASDIKAADGTTLEQFKTDTTTHLADMKTQIKIKPNITITAANWVDYTATSGFFIYDLADTDITANTIVNVNIRVNDLDKAATIKSANQSFDGKVRLYASSAPAADIIADLCLTRAVA